MKKIILFILILFPNVVMADQQNLDVSLTITDAPPTVQSSSAETDSGSGSGKSSSITIECNDQKDNDHDSFKDYPEDRGCTSKEDTSEQSVKECYEKWICDPWTECLRNEYNSYVQLRECFDMNQCKTYKEKPVTEEICGTKEEKPFVQGQQTKSRNISIFVIMIAVSYLLWVEVQQNKKIKNYIRKFFK